ncbi:MAG: efflux RND transporter periplasmic adaptor subunit [Patescibacteria group bacterium]
MGNSSIRPDLELAYYKIAGIASDFDAKANSTVNVDETNLIAQLDQLSSYYKDSKAYLAVVTRYLENSITSSEFPQSSVDGYINTYTGYKNEVASLEAGYVNFRNGAASFLATYRNNESSALAGLEVQRKQIEVQKNGLNTGEFEANLGLDRTKIEIEKTLSTYKNVVDNAQANYDNAVKNKDITLRKLEVTQTDAALSLQQAQEELSKLSILAPIDGTVTKVIASVGQDVNAGTPMVEIANKNPEVVFDVDFDTVGQLKIGATSPVLYEEKSYTGTVVGVSQVASDSLQYSVRVALSQSPALIGGIAKISLKLPSAMPILPTKMVKVLTEQTGEIQTFSGGVFVPKTVKLGRISGSTIEILTPIDLETEIVTSDITNFDARKFEPKKKDAAVETK